MNRLEFNEVMKNVGINNPLTTTTGIYNSSEEVHYWQNIAIYFGGSYFTVVKGKIPLEVANIIYEKYPNNPYEIRVDGGCSDWNPNERCIDDKYKKDIQEYVEQNLNDEEYLEKCKKARKNLSRRVNENKYIGTYNIDTKEGLVILLLEMKDYFARKQGLVETEVKRFDELMATINSRILKKVNPYISTYEWMKSDSKNSEIFLRTVENDRKTSFGKQFRNAIDKFDKVVNPYINEKIDLDEMINYLSKVNISSDVYNFENGMQRENCCQIHITDIASKNKVSYYRRPDGFSYQLMYTLGNQQYLSVLHYYSTRVEQDDIGEVIYINYFGDNIPQEIDVRYNITHGVVGKTYGEKSSITLEQKEWIYDELLKAINLASTITIDNMKKRGYSKQLTQNDQ